MYQVVDWEQDIAGKFRYRVIIGDESVMFKFHTFPTGEDVQAEATRYAAMTAEALLAQEQVDGAPNSE